MEKLLKSKYTHIYCLLTAIVSLLAFVPVASAALPVPPGGTVIDTQYGCSPSGATGANASSTYLHEACALQIASVQKGMIQSDGVYRENIGFIEDCVQQVRFWFGSGGCTPFRSPHTFRDAQGKVHAVVYEQDAGSSTRAPNRFVCEYVSVIQGSDKTHSLAAFPTYYDQSRRCFNY